MREMKDSGIDWIGTIPQDWQLSKSGSLYTQRNEKVSDKDYQPLSVTMQGILPQLATAAKTDDGDNRKLVRVGDFAINSRSDRRGSCGISPLDGSVSLINIILTPRTAMHPGYYNWLFHTTLFADEFYKWGHGIVADLWTTRWQEMKSITVPVPEYAEQERIAAFLDAECAEIDTVLEKTRASIEEYKKLKQAVITQAVTKGIRGDRPMKDSGIEWIGEIPAEWNKDKVIRVFSVIGSGTTPKSSDENLFGGNTPWIQSGDINGENLFVTKNCVSNSAIESYSALRVYQAPYLVVAMYGASVGNLSLSMIDACVNQACCVLKKPTINLKFSFYIFKAVKDYLTRKAVGGGQPNISQETIKQLWLPVPSADEQIEISNYLDEKCRSVDALIAKKQQYITEIENYKKSLIYEYVTGKKEVV